MALLRNDALRLNPIFRKMPKDDSEWKTFIKALNGQHFQMNAEMFTPGWAGFSADPTFDMSYIDLNTHVVLFTTGGTGTSDSTQMTMTGLPSSLRPSITRAALCLVYDDNVIIMASCSIANTGNIFFSTAVATGTPVTFNSTGFTNSGQKGLPAGWTVIYPK